MALVHAQMQTGAIKVNGILHVERLQATTRSGLNAAQVQLTAALCSGTYSPSLYYFAGNEY